MDPRGSAATEGELSWDTDGTEGQPEFTELDPSAQASGRIALPTRPAGEYARIKTDQRGLVVPPPFAADSNASPKAHLSSARVLRLRPP
ncbi:MAG: hypothetical protein RLZZ221_1687 [Verrucomicrobiota bacterium]